MSNATCAVMICAGQKMMLAQPVNCLFTPEVNKKITHDHVTLSAANLLRDSLLYKESPKSFLYDSAIISIAKHHKIVVM